MTREEAIYELKNAAWLGTDHSRARTEEALDMAIKALSQEPCTDAVSREEVKKIVDFYTEQYDGIFHVNESIDKLPSVNSQPCDDTVSRQAVLEMAYDMSEIDGEHFTEPCMVVDVEDIQKLPSVNPIPCLDAISRQAVINAIENDCMKGGLGSCFACYNDAQAFRGEIEKLPSVTHKSGKWIPVSERLPDNTDDVLVYDYSDIFVAWYSGIHGNWCSADNRFDEYTPIIAWMPLPKPYEPQESEDKE